MTITKRDLEIINNCYLIRPRGDRAKQMLRFLHGSISNIEADTDAAMSGLPAIYFAKSFRDGFLTLVRNAEIIIKTTKITGAPVELAESAIILYIAYRPTGIRMSFEDMLSTYQEIEATTFIGVPTEAIWLSARFDELLVGCRIGRFTIGGDSFVEHRRRFGILPNDPLPSVGLWIKRQPISCRILSAALDNTLDKVFRDHHLTHVTSFLAKQFKTDFADDQSLPVALGAPAFDSDALFSIDKLRIDVAFGEHACSSGTLLSGGSRAIPDDLAKVRERCSLFVELLGNHSLGAFVAIDRMLGTFSRFLLKAESHRSGSRQSEAFIHCVFALDLALGGKEDSTKNTTRRAAAIYSAAANMPFKDAEGELRLIFDARSKYVHEGTEVPEQRFLLLLECCRLVAECLLRARDSHEAASDKFITQHWYPRLDLVVAAMRAGVELSTEHYNNCGMKISPKVGTVLIGKSP